MESISYYPQFGNVLPNGHLRIPTAAVSEDGERLDGSVEIGSDHPMYAEWLDLINNKEQFLEDQSRAVMQAREERRAANQKADQNQIPSEFRKPNKS